jgi:hypothetical protein
MNNDPVHRRFGVLRFVVLASAVAVQAGGLAICFAVEPPPPKPHPFGQREHVVQRLNAEKEPVNLPAEILWISEPWLRERADENAQMPYLTYLPEKDRVLMLVETHQPIVTAFISSDDHGKTWSDRKWLSTDGQGRPVGVALGLTNLGGGRLMAYPENAAHDRWLSVDYGQTWTVFTHKDTVAERYIWDPLLLLKDSSGRIQKILEASWRPTGVPWGSPDGYYSQAYLRQSTDEGRTWGDEVKVPQWLGVNEINLFRAANGDLIAACRTDYPKRFAHLKLDHFGGLAVSVSKDEGQTWSDLNPLYEWGRHHPSIAMLANGNLLMTYVVRLGYPATYAGVPQFGVEAVVSRDNGQSWDKEHRYILASWEGNITGENAWFCGVQSTSTVLLPDGTILTSFGTGFRNPSDAKVCKMDVALVRWRMDKSQP